MSGWLLPGFAFLKGETLIRLKLKKAECDNIIALITPKPLKYTGSEADSNDHWGSPR